MQPLLLLSLAPIVEPANTGAGVAHLAHIARHHFVGPPCTGGDEMELHLQVLNIAGRRIRLHDREIGSRGNLHHAAAWQLAHASALFDRLALAIGHAVHIARTDHRQPCFEVLAVLLGILVQHQVAGARDDRRDPWKAPPLPRATGREVVDDAFGRNELACRPAPREDDRFAGMLVEEVVARDLSDCVVGDPLDDVVAVDAPHAAVVEPIDFKQLELNRNRQAIGGPTIPDPHHHLAVTLRRLVRKQHQAIDIEPAIRIGKRRPFLPGCRVLFTVLPSRDDPGSDDVRAVRPEALRDVGHVLLQRATAHAQGACVRGMVCVGAGPGPLRAPSITRAGPLVGTLQ
ncbi:hypothetical protein D3C86_1356630 [compost metagenome]